MFHCLTRFGNERRLDADTVDGDVPYISQEVFKGRLHRVDDPTAVNDIVWDINANPDTDRWFCGAVSIFFFFADCDQSGIQVCTMLLLLRDSIFP